MGETTRPRRPRSLRPGYNHGSNKPRRARRGPPSRGAPSATSDAEMSRAPSRAGRSVEPTARSRARAPSSPPASEARDAHPSDPESQSVTGKPASARMGKIEAARATPHGRWRSRRDRSRSRSAPRPPPGKARSPCRRYGRSARARRRCRPDRTRPHRPSWGRSARSRCRGSSTLGATRHQRSGTEDRHEVVLGAREARPAHAVVAHADFTRLGVDVVRVAADEERVLEHDEVGAVAVDDRVGLERHDGSHRRCRAPDGCSWCFLRPRRLRRVAPRRRRAARPIRSRSTLRA